MKINKNDLVFTKVDKVDEKTMIGIGRVLYIRNPPQHNCKKPYRVMCNGKIYDFNKKDLYKYEEEK